MSGKFQKEQTQKRKKKGPLVWTLVILLVLVLAEAAYVVLTGALDKDTPKASEPPQTAPAQTEDVNIDQPPVDETEPQSTTEETVLSPQEQFGTVETYSQTADTQLPIHLGEGLVITQIGSYAGLYLEDGSDELVSGILMIGLENTSELDLQLAKITLEYGDSTASFTVTNLPAGRKVILLEQNRMAYIPQDPDSARAENTVFLDGFDMHEDQLEIVALDGVINVTNISDQDIDRDIFVYYKNIAGGVFYGGITYRVRMVPSIMMPTDPRF